MKYLVALIISFITINLNLSAQTLGADGFKFSGMGEDSVFWPSDNNGESSVKIIVDCNVGNLELESDLISKTEIVDGKSVIYLFPRAKPKKTLTIRHEKYALTEVLLWDNDRPLQRGGVYYLNVVASKNTATVLMESRPSVAEINVDGKDLGRTPCEVELLPGIHKIVISKYGYQTLRKPLKVDSTESLKLEFELSRSIAERLVTVRFTAPKGSRILFDKESLSAPYEKRTTRGKHEVECLINGKLMKKTLECKSDTVINLR